MSPHHDDARQGRPRDDSCLSWDEVGSSSEDRPDEVLDAVIVEIGIESEDIPEFERLVPIYGEGDRSEFLRQAIRIMAGRECAERLQRASPEIGESGERG